MVHLGFTANIGQDSNYFVNSHFVSQLDQVLQEQGLSHHRVLELQMLSVMLSSTEDKYLLSLKVI